ncbi:unnamed protein product [Durusdinium trenchii]|uniref:Uncharacterized protein n=1 Tax=Durusdinium trenchii TaxID=1381693 RepID=A0ABP0JLY9_9DINO
MLTVSEQTRSRVESMSFLVTGQCFARPGSSFTRATMQFARFWLRAVCQELSFNVLKHVFYQGYNITYTACLSTTGREACAEDGHREKKFIIPIFNRCDVDLTMKLCTVLLILALAKSGHVCLFCWVPKQTDV